MIRQVKQSIEGPVIIVFNHKDHWYLSTNRKLNAFKSYWADPKSSFGLTFAYGVFKKIRRLDLIKLTDPQVIKQELDKVFDKYLSRSNRYIFIQPPTYTERLATVPSEEHPAPVHVSTFAFQDIKASPGNDRLTKTLARVPFANTPAKYKLPKRSPNLYKHICTLANKINPDEAQGILIEVPNGTFIKVLNTEYYKRMQIRGTVPSLKGRYMQLRKDPVALGQFINYYPEVSSKEIESSIAATCSTLETVYFLVTNNVPQDHLRTVLEHEGYIVESLDLSKVLYDNLLQQNQFVEAVIETGPTFQRLSITNTPRFNKLASKVKFHTTKARHAIIQSQIDFLNSLDIN
jgi:hypothetical protein